jgi:phosphate ABC transporter phosphate-binding protein
VNGTTILTRARRAWPRRVTIRGHALRRLRLIALCLGLVFTFLAVELGTVPFATVPPPAAKAASYAPITGAGSTWAYPAIHAWIDDMNQYGLTINYTANGSTSGRNFFADGQADWAASEIPYGLVDGNVTDPPPSRGYVYVPDVAGGTVLMYNLQINGQQVTNLRLSGQTVADIFTNKITNWDNSEIAADNPGLSLPNLPITPVVRSDGSGSTYDFTQWMNDTTSDWTAYCPVVGRTPCTPTSTYPVQSGTNMIAQSGDPGVATYVAQASSNGAIGYTEYAWALQEGFPVAKLLNADGYYTLPSPGHVAVSLEADQVNTSNPNDPSTYLTQNLTGVYTDMDPRTYELSAYSYFILPTDLSNGMSDDKGYTIGTFGTYALCLGQSQVDVLGYSALPFNLVQAGFEQLTKIPGSTVPADTQTALASCDNPTFTATSSATTDLLAQDDPQPLACDKKGTTQCAAGIAEPAETNVSTNVTNGNGTGSTTPATTSTTPAASTGTTSTSAATTGSTSTSAATTGSTSTSAATTGSTSTSGTTSTSAARSTSGTSTSAAKGTTGTTSTGGSTASGTTNGATSGPATGTSSGDVPGTIGSGTGTTGTTGTTGNSEVGGSSGTNSEVGGSATTGQAVSDTPVSLASSNGSGFEVTLMALAAAMMFALSVVPPLIAQAGRRKRQRRGIDEFYDGNDWPGDRR